MATQGDDNKVVCNSKVNIDQEKNFITVYKKFDWILNNKNESFTKKSESLVEVWTSLAQCKFENSDIQYIVQIIDWAKLHTLNIVLTGEWKKFKDFYQEPLLREVKQTQNQLSQINSAFFTRCQKLLDVINNPWSDPTLEYLVQTPNADISARVIEFFCAETAYLISVRLKKLCESQCEDLALNLVKAFMKCYRLSQIENFNLNATETQVWFIFDIYVALLYKFKENECLLEMLKGLSPEEGLSLIKRFAKKRVTISKIWKHCHKIAVLSSQVYISSTVQRPIEEIRSVLRELIKAYIILNNSDAYLKDVTDTLRSIIRLADSAAHIYIFCDVFQEEFPSKLRAFIIELYIRALTTDMNLLERQKSDTDKGNLTETTERLANGFTSLAEVLKGDVTVSRECTMTAFSLKPTRERLKKIEELARLSGFEVLDTGQEWKCKLHPPMLPSDDVAWKCNSCGEYMCKPQLNVPLNTNTALNEAITEEKLGITRELCDDLVVLLSCPRYQVFSWLLDWPNLHRLCLMYFNDPESIKKVVTELKFVDIDYSIFATIKKEPLDEYAGIERGYEQYLDHEFNSDEEQLKEDILSEDPRFFANGYENSHEIPVQQKSDPNTLKSLRLFRPNLKRARNNVDLNVPEKMLRSDQNDYAIPCSSKQNDFSYAPMRYSAQNGSKTYNNFYTDRSYSDSHYVHNGVLPRTHDVANNIPSFHNNDASTYGNPTFADNNPMHFGNNVQTVDPTRNYVNHFDSTYYKMYPGKNSNANYPNANAINTATQSSYSMTNNVNVQAFSDTNLHPKNGQVATLQQVGGQVAIRNSQVDGSLNTNFVHGSPNNIISNQDRDISTSKTMRRSNNYSNSNSTKGAPIRKYATAQITTTMVSNKIYAKTQNTMFPNISDNANSDSIIERNENNALFSDKLQIRIPKLEMDELIKQCKNQSSTELFSVKSDPEKTKFVDSNAEDADNSLSESEYDYIPASNPLHEVLSTLDNFKNSSKSLGMKDKETFIQKNYFENKIETGKKRRKLKSNRPYLIDDIKYESYPDTGSDGQVEQDSDDQYNRCYIELSKNNLLYDATKGVCKNIENYLKGPMKLNDSIDSKRGKKHKKYTSRKAKKSKTDATSVDKPKIDVPIKDVRVVIDRLPVELFKYHMKNYPEADVRTETVIENSTSSNRNTDKTQQNLNQVKMKDAKVLLERLSVTNNSYVRSVLANVPGLHDTELIRPANTEIVVNVVQIAGGRNNSSVPVANTQTSTQVSPHIQRIGQPRVEKTNQDQTDSSESAATTSVGNVKPTTSQPSTLINILSQQVIRPGQSTIRTKSSPLINIVSHQIIKPSTQVVPKMITSSAQTIEQVNDSSKTEATAEQATPIVKNVTAMVKTAATGGATTAPAPGTILQFICKSTSLPKFQQAFGKSVYQANSIESSDATSTVETVSSSDAKKTPIVKNPLNIQPLQGSVIYTRQVPVGQTINLIQPGRQVFRIASSNPDQISFVKDTVIHSKMSALLTAALQGKKTTEVVESDGNNDNAERATLTTRPTLVQNARIVKPVIQIPSNVIRTSSTNTQSNLSSTTLEQLREFDMVYKQIKERSNTGSTPSESSTQSEPETSPQEISVTYLTQGQKFAQLSPVVVVSSYCNLQPAASPALSVTSQGSSSPCVTPASTPTLPKVSSKTSKGKSLKNASSTHTASKASPIPKPQQKPQEDEHTTQRIFDILAEYAEQLRNSPDLNNKPAPRRRSNPPTNLNHNSKRKKSSSSKKPTVIGSAISESDLDDQRTIGSEDSSCGVVQLSIKDDEPPQSQTTESNETARPLILTENSTNQTTRNLIIADSSVGEALKLQNTAVLVPGNYIMPVSMVKGGQQIAVVSGGSKILATVPARSGQNMLLLQSFLNQNRKPGVSAVKYSTLQPISGISSQNVASVSGQSPIILPQNAHNLTAVSLGQPITLKKVDDSENRRNTELLLAIAQPRDNANTAESSSHPNSGGNVQNSSNSIKFDDDNNSTQKVYTYQKTIAATPIATPVISQTSHIKNGSEESTSPSQPSIITLNISSDGNKDDAKTAKRVQSVLVTTCTSTNGPMFSHTPPRYRKPSEVITVNNDVGAKGNFLQNREKQKDETKQFQTTTVYLPNKNKKITATNSARLDREIQQLCLQRKQAALERELRLQKSLSEECEDLGVDEPSTSDLFPEADLLFDSNHSPSFDQTTHDIGKKILHQDMKDKSITLFSDDDNSSSLRADFLFDTIQYHPEAELQYEQSRQITNGGQSSTSNESGSSCEDNTLLQNCASMSDVTLNSPISPELTDNTTHMNKYKFKYSNRKKTERHKNETWTTGGEVSSSEDTMCSEIGKVTNSPKRCVIKRESHSSSCDEDDEFKVVRVAISKTDLAKDEESCEESHYDDDLDSPSGRGARRSVKKMCSCCNGAQEGGNRKRPSSRPHTPALHKKAFLNKKR